jgi:glycosyltransferase involved in cell wall biosynthesis
MKIAIATTFVPFIKGGDRKIVEGLSNHLSKEGHHVELVMIPQAENLDNLANQMAAIRDYRIDNADLLICLRPQSHLIPHRNKVIWFIHHIRKYYDLYNSRETGSLDPDDELQRKAVILEDNLALKTARKIFANSRVVQQRLWDFNQTRSEVLLPPHPDLSLFRDSGSNDELVCVSRVERHKRQHLLVQAMNHTKTAVRLRIAGRSTDPTYTNEIRQMIATHNLQERVVFEEGWLSEQAKGDLVNSCLAVCYTPEDEDSYGYFTLEAFQSSKAMVTTNDSGGLLEIVKDGVTGLVAAPTAAGLARAFDKVFVNRTLARNLGQTAHESTQGLEISWNNVSSKLLS